MAFHGWWAPSAAAAPMAAPWRWLQIADAAPPVEGGSEAPEQESSGGGHPEQTEVKQRRRRVLHLFSGPKDLSEGLAACLRESGMAAEEVDVIDE